MKQLLLILSLLFSITARSQEDPAQLAKQITQNAKTDEEKVTAIFHWVTGNIDYRTRSPYKINVIGRATLKYSKTTDDVNDTGALKPLNERVSVTVLRTRLAVCEGYARLFTTLCDFAGIRSEIIAGYARSTDNKSTSKFSVNHYWNAVMIDSNWYLLDATWASGYVTRGDEFIREYDPAYFLTSPSEFIKNHYPDDIRWTLLSPNKIPGEFLRSPFLQKSYSKYSIAAYYPKKGIIEASVGDTVQFELSTTDVKRDKAISPDYLIDSAIFSHSGSWIFLQPEQPGPADILTNRHIYTLPILNSNIEWVYLMYNDDMVLRYKINVKVQKDVAVRQWSIVNSQ